MTRVVFDIAELRGLANTCEQVAEATSQARLALSRVPHGIATHVGDLSALSDRFRIRGSKIRALASLVEEQEVFGPATVTPFSLVGVIQHWLRQAVAEARLRGEEKAPGAGGTAQVAGSDLTVEKVVDWAKNKVGSTAYNGWCLLFVGEAYRSAGVPFESVGKDKGAIHWYEMFKDKVQQGPAPKGALIFWGADKSNDGFGHVELSLGDGTTIGTGWDNNPSTPTGMVTHKPLRNDKPSIGWIMPGM